MRVGKGKGVRRIGRRIGVKNKPFKLYQLSGPKGNAFRNTVQEFRLKLEIKKVKKKLKGAGCGFSKTQLERKVLQIYSFIV